MKKKNPTPILAVNGGKPVFSGHLPSTYKADTRELAAAARVINRGPLSGFLGSAGKLFLGGPEVRAFEKEFAIKFKIAHAVSFNSATTALHGAMVALGIGPGDEIIVPSYTISASATPILMNGAIPIFADVDKRTFTIDPVSVEKLITKRTRAIVVVNLNGQGADFARLLPLAQKHRLAIIEDNAQAPGAKWKGKFLGTVGDIGVFSFNVNKFMQTGEGGVLVTRNKKYALRAQLARNHGETSAEAQDEREPIFGSNYRMTEVVAAMARVELKKLDFLIKKRITLAKRLEKGLLNIPGLILPYVPPGNTHVYYRYMMQIDEKKLGLSREKLFAAMAAEGFPLSKNISTPVHLLPIFQKKQAFNKTHFPFDYGDSRQDYSRGICPVSERLCEKDGFSTNICQYPRTEKHIDFFVEAFKKVLAHKDEF